MRTTLTLDSDVAARVKRLAHRRSATFKETINDLLRRGLQAQEAGPDEVFEVVPHNGGFKPGVDPARLNQLLDELDAEDFVEEAAASEAPES